MYVDALIDGAISLANTGIQQAYADKVTKETFAREDSAVQRRVADLKAAGLSPVLAAGSAAGSSSPVSVGAPQIDFSAMDRARLAADMAQQKKNIERTDAEIAAINAQSAPAKIMRDVMEKALTLKNEDGRDMINVLAQNWLKTQDATTRSSMAAATERETQAAMLSRMLQFDVEKGVFNPAMRDMAGNTEFFRNLVNNGDPGDWLGAMLQLAGKYRGGK